MMRKLALIVLLAAGSLTAGAAKRVTVEQMSQLVAAERAKPDVELAQKLADLELTERLSDAEFTRLKAELPGENSVKALRVLADASEFLEPPAADLPALAAPDVATQRRMLGLTVGYVSKIIPQLPNLFATRVTTQFEDTPQLESVGGLAPYQPVHFSGSTKATVFYRDGREEADAGTGKERKTMGVQQGLNTWGVFGPILSTVLLDAARSKLEWSHWERGDSGSRAVFSFAVPKEKSHYEVNFCCIAFQAATEAANVKVFRQTIGYRGEMAIDPATGTILRLVVEADLKPTDPVVKAAILVEYGPVDIGGKTYFCPVRSLSSALAQTVQLDLVYKYPLARQLQPLKNSLSENVFEDYHVFRGDARVVSAAEAEAAERAPLLPTGAATTEASATPSPVTPTEPVAAVSAAAALPQPAAMVEPVVPEMSVTEGAAIPDVAVRSSPAEPSGGFTLRTTARLVDLGVVAYDKKGRPVTDLKPQDFEVYDNGRKQQIRDFAPAAASALNTGEPVAGGRPGDAQPIFTNSHNAGADAKSKGAEPERNTTILLIDSGNVAWGDLSYARSQMLRFLSTLAAGEQAGIYVMKGLGFEVLAEPSADHAQLAVTLAKWMPNAQDLSRAQAEEESNRQHFEYVHSGTDLAYVNGNGNSDPEGSLSGGGRAASVATPTDAKLMGLGSNPERDAFFILGGVARHLATLSGHKSLVWVASDNVLADWSNQVSVRLDKGSKFIDTVALSAQEALNDAHVSIYPLDVSQLEVGGISADLGTRNVLPMGMSDRDKSTAGMGDTAPGMKPGREAAQMQQDTHPIQGAFRELAEATGGQVFRRSGGIADELNAVVNDGRASYLLSFTPDVPADDSYHHLTVKLAGRRDLVLRYRIGYQYDKEPTTVKDRFRRAVWQAADLNEIALKAIPEAEAAGKAVDLTIATADLDLEQQNKFWGDKLDIFLVLRDDAGLHAQVTGQTLGLHLGAASRERLLGAGIPFEEKVEAKPETSSVRIIVIDENSGRMGSVTLPAGALGNKRSGTN
jgi:VWFA-related protein